MTFAKLKRTLHRHTNVPVIDMELTMNDAALDDDALLVDMSVTDDSLIYLHVLEPLPSQVESSAGSPFRYELRVHAVSE